MSRNHIILRKLERELRRTIKRIDFNNLLNKIHLTPTAAYDVDKNGNVIALVLEGLSIKRVPEAIFELTHLRMLSLSWNKLEEVPARISGLSGLKHFRLHDAGLKRLPAEILDLGLEFVHGWPQEDEVGVEGIIIDKNPLEFPPIEIVQQGRRAVRRYLDSLRQELIETNEAKVLFVGDGGAGKTCLVKCLMGKGFNPNESQTHGINIDKWSVKNTERRIQLHLWDFGGQDIMHATHLFFLSERSLYVLVLDGRKEEDAEYWLKHIESFGGTSPILVVLNKVDQNPSYDLNRRFLQGKYKGIVGFYPISCRTGKGIPKLKVALRESLHQVEIVHTAWPASWFRVKENLETITTHFISREEYEAICLQQRVTDPEDQDSLAKFLHDLGVVVHFSDFNLTHMHVLEPRWLTGGVYRLVNAPSLAERHGILQLSSLPHILRRKKNQDFSYPSYTHPYIIELMKKFELCYSIDSTKALVPDLLNIQEPIIDFDYERALNFRLDYDFFPRSVIPRFIVKMNKDMQDDLRWRTGVVLTDDTFRSTAVVKADQAAKRIYIHVLGEQHRDYLTVVRAAFLEINQSFEKLEVSEKICMPDAPEVTVSFDHLTRLEREGVEEIYPDGGTHSYKVRDLLGTVGVESKRSEKDFIRILKMALSESETRETAVAKANRIITLQPNFFGMGVNLNAIVDRLLPKRPSRAKSVATKGNRA